MGRERKRREIVGFISWFGTQVKPITQNLTQKKIVYSSGPVMDIKY